MTCVNRAEPFIHYVGESKVYYFDLGECFKGRSLVSVVSVVSDDALLTFASTSIISVDTSDYDQYGNAITIEANTGIQTTIAAGTAGDDDDEYTATITITVTTAAGTEQERFRVKVCDV